MNQQPLKMQATSLKEATKYRAIASPRQDVVDGDLSMRHLLAELARIDTHIAQTVQHWQAAGRDPNDAFRGLIITDAEAGNLLALPFSGNWSQTGKLDETERAAFAGVRSDLESGAGELAELAKQHGQRLRLPHLCDAFGLDDFERDVLLVCLAPALDLRYEQLFAYLQNDAIKRRPTVNLILDLLCPPGPDRLKMMAKFAGTAPLFRHQLIDIVPEPSQPNPTLLATSLAPDPTIVAWLLGEYRPRASFGPCVSLRQPALNAELDLLTGAVRAQLDHAARIDRPMLILSGADQDAEDAAACRLAAELKRPLLSMDLSALVAQGTPPIAAARLALRDARLNHAVAHLRAWDVALEESNASDPLLIELCAYPDVLVISGRTWWRPEGIDRSRPILSIEFSMPDYAQRQRLWGHFLEDEILAGAKVDAVAMAGHFTLNTRQIRDAVASARDLAVQRGDQLNQSDLFAAARAHSSARLSDMAHKILPRFEWGDLILPDDQLAILRELVDTVRNRSLVLEEWGLGEKLASSAAVAVLFAGPPGTGKTMAAEVIAKDLGLDLYKIDLSGLVSKYIGETEKNLERIFTEAQSSNAILFFDEADAIFGKRSGVKDARDRYANIEVSYLLQRMETYDGVTILATNLRSNIDEAFLRRLQFVVDVPFPDEKDRLRIWRTLMPNSVPQADDIKLDEMAKRFKMAGGNIRNIIVSAVYLAATDGGVLTMEHLLHGTRRELQKMGRLIAEDHMQTGR